MRYNHLTGGEIFHFQHCLFSDFHKLIDLKKKYGAMVRAFTMRPVFSIAHLLQIVTLR